MLIIEEFLPLNAAPIYNLDPINTCFYLDENKTIINHTGIFTIKVPLIKSLKDKEMNNFINIISNLLTLKTNNCVCRRIYGGKNIGNGIVIFCNIVEKE